MLGLWVCVSCIRWHHRAVRLTQTLLTGLGKLNHTLEPCVLYVHISTFPPSFVSLRKARGSVVYTTHIHTPRNSPTLAPLRGVGPLRSPEKRDAALLCREMRRGNLEDGGNEKLPEEKILGLSVILLFTQLWSSKVFHSSDKSFEFQQALKWAVLNTWTEPGFLPRGI